MTDDATPLPPAPDPGVLRAEARVARARAELCREIADGIDRRRSAMVERIGPARAAHTPDVWSSAAADRSRARLDRHVSAGLSYLARDLGLTSTRLRDEATSLESRARGLVTDADEIETLVLRGSTGG